MKRRTLGLVLLLALGTGCADPFAPDPEDEYRDLLTCQLIWNLAGLYLYDRCF